MRNLIIGGAAVQRMYVGRLPAVRAYWGRLLVWDAKRPHTPMELGATADNSSGEARLVLAKKTALRLLMTDCADAGERAELRTEGAEMPESGPVVPSWEAQSETRGAGAVRADPKAELPGWERQASALASSARKAAPEVEPPGWEKPAEAKPPGVRPAEAEKDTPAWGRRAEAGSAGILPASIQASPVWAASAETAAAQCAKALRPATESGPENELDGRAGDAEGTGEAADSGDADGAAALRLHEVAETKAAAEAGAEDSAALSLWPRWFDYTEGVLTIYQSFDYSVSGDTLTLN